METIKNIKLPDGNTYKIGGGLDDKITNCITEIPQDIKLELNDGVLTLKAGSKVYVPNGFEDDGITPKFDEVVIESDINGSQAGTLSGIFYLVNPNRGGASSVASSNIYSGSTEPTGTTYAVWYDTANNRIGLRLTGSSTFTFGYSFPVCVGTIANNLVTSIDQTFNGFGYIGSTVFVTKGVKGLIPNGRNEDGSLNNTEFEFTKLMTRTQTSSGNKCLVLRSDYISQGFVHLTYEQSTPPNGESGANWYNPTDNYWRFWDTNTNSFVISQNGFNYGTVIVDANFKVTNFTPKLPFRAVDYNDLTSIVPTGTVISSASSATPTGCLYCNGAAVSRTTYAKLFSAIGTTYGTGDGSTTFNLPNYSNYNFVTSNTVSVKGTGKTLGFTNGTTSFGTKYTTNTHRIMLNGDAYNVAVGGTIGSGAQPNDNQAVGITIDASKSGITGTVSTAKINWYIKY